MPAYTTRNGNRLDHWADEIDYLLYCAESISWQPCSLDEAQGKIITMTAVHPQTGMVTVYIKSPKDVGLTPCN